MKMGLSLREELSQIVDAVAILSPTAFTFADNPSTGIAMPVFGLQLASDMPPFLGELSSVVYQHCYCRRFRGRMENDPASKEQGNGEWIAALTRANQSRERWEDGWQVLHTTANGHVAAKRGGITRMLAPGEFVNLSGSGVVLAPGTTVRVYVPRESLTSQPGYYFMFGENLPDSSDESSIVRFYWNISPEGVPQLLQLLSGELNRWQVPFRFKTRSQQTSVRRSDGAVLYTSRRHADFTYKIVSEICRRLERLLIDEVPLFTLRLAPGLAFAEDPGSQESFGMSRCRMLAEGIWSAYKKNAKQTFERLECVEEWFSSVGISLDHPWLNAGSADEFKFAAIDPAAE
jgi:hypothetical protein